MNDNNDLHEGENLEKSASEEMPQEGETTEDAQAQTTTDDAQKADS
ncbi:hypothetical protein Bequi_12470 [Brachybacterium sp. JHP9]|uniref:Nucleotide exchange factor GrpE n=1 Tax=Brachybacterium equifaecis TaxID=2910770 RepID=A0ABT0R2P0_9MICO|nr:hypothetical protein [Brachybacterium equifaecis]MCL6424182.1 hypothetical protein [Brachybacterium equifaecis]